MKKDESFGTFGEQAYLFVDFLNRSNQKIWQVLPLTQVDSVLSPYSSPDSFAGNHLLIDLKDLDQKNLLNEKDWESVQVKNKDAYKKNKEVLLRKIYTNWINEPENEKELLKFSKEEKWWLEDHLKYYLHLNANEDRNYLIFLQKIFLDQYLKLKKYANERKIVIFGDLPFYVNFNSRDVFTESKYFLLNDEGEPIYQGAVPPDDFQKKGQIWGTPVYNWETLEKDGFSYWKKKIKRLSFLYDYLRIDHFRGLESYYRVPWNAEDALEGEWVVAPGDRLLGILKEIPNVKIIGENLGHITKEVDYLLEKYNIPGMKILQFIQEDLFLIEEKEDTVYYTGTHDNYTILSWIRKKYKPKKEIEKDLVWDFIKKIYYSKAAWAIIPFQDLLELDDSGRMNTPGTIKGNWLWTWNGSFKELSELEIKLQQLTKISDRR